MTYEKLDSKATQRQENSQACEEERFKHCVELRNNITLVSNEAPGHGNIV